MFVDSVNLCHCNPALVGGMSRLTGMMQHAIFYYLNKVTVQVDKEQGIVTPFVDGDVLGH